MKPVKENGQAWADLTSTTSPSTFITVVSPAQTARNEDTSFPHPKGNTGLNYYNSLLDVLPCDLYSSSKMQQAQLVFNLAKFSTLHCSFASCTGYLWLLQSHSSHHCAAKGPGPSSIKDMVKPHFPSPSTTNSRLLIVYSGEKGVKF